MAIDRVFILGNHIQALGLARQLKEKNIQVTLFTKDRYSITRFSNAVKHTLFFSDTEELLRIIKQQQNKAKSTFLFPTNDAMVDFLLKHHREFAKDYYVGLPAAEIVETFYNKKNTHHFALMHDIPVPDTFFPETVNDLEKHAADLTYPVVLKPAVMHTFHKVFGKKAFRCDNKDGLMKKAKEIALKMPFNGIMVQEFLDGGAKHLFSYGTFAVNGKPMASVMVNRIRQNPMIFGNSTTFAKTCYIQEIKKHAEDILKKTNYTGLAEIEFMFDNHSGKYKFLEINSRAWKWHSISNKLGFSFINHWIQYLNDSEIIEFNDFQKEAAWVDRLTDFAVALKEIYKGHMQISSFISSYKIKKEYAVWCPNDLLPFIMYLLMSPILYFKRH